MAPRVKNQKDVLESQLASLGLKTKILTPKGIEYIKYSQNPYEFLETLINLKADNAESVKEIITSKEN